MPGDGQMASSEMLSQEVVPRKGQYENCGIDDAWWMWLRLGILGREIVETSNRPLMLQTSIPNGKFQLLETEVIARSGSDARPALPTLRYVALGRDAELDRPSRRPGASSRGSAPNAFGCGPRGLTLRYRESPPAMRRPGGIARYGTVPLTANKVANDWQALSLGRRRTHGSGRGKVRATTATIKRGPGYCTRSWLRALEVV
ncbi:uncharacterized protein NECHADRAFT_85081 [Fusarium vanettenii 77-13-4]|uniref:Uncharacterized protein n=1 Tax=Fusarium vanettenii (strain ATCC MYA-4622 / CBS 123669 / FGSC 9596 / NRRL 45880 / 77-13-4) TaxID=660122 RepID=C7YUY2_FUSV7|nr:uncharacterized protein NECHADRAFT_85081 [Fusarium vanettenii 77-13-4]EEU44888.1 predicted protein [Fusarium vanettenii 77-13-4]